MSERTPSGLETLDRPLELDAKAEGDAAGVIKGYASIWGVVDNGNDEVMRGAFKTSLVKRKSQAIPMLVGHNQQAVPIGVWDVIKEDSKGLYVEGRLAMSSDAGKQMHEVLKLGGAMGISIGYRTLKKEIHVPNGKPGVEANEWSPGAIRRLVEVDLREISLVPIPMLDVARVTSVKGDVETDDPSILALKQLGDDLDTEAALTGLANEFYR